MNCIKDGKFTGAGCEGCQIDPSGCHLREIVLARKEKRLRIIDRPAPGTCGTCGNWERIDQSAAGCCKLRSKIMDRYGRPTKLQFRPYQSHRACKAYKPREETP